MAQLFVILEDRARYLQVFKGGKVGKDVIFLGVYVTPARSR